MNYEEYIADYLNGSLEGEDLEAFERELAQNTELQKLAEAWKSADQIISKHIRAEENLGNLKSTLNHFKTVYFQTEKKKGRVISMRWVSAVASVAAVFIIAYFLFLSPNINNFQLPDYPNAVVRGVQNNTKKGAQLFNKKNYKEALLYLKAVYENKPDDATSAYFYALCLMKVEDYDSALPILDAITQGTSVYKDEANFFAAYCAYKTDKKKDVLNYAMKVGKDNPNYASAQKLIKKLH